MTLDFVYKIRNERPWIVSDEFPIVITDGSETP